MAEEQAPETGKDVQEKPPELSVIELAELAAQKANEAAARLEAANKKAEELLVRQTMGGKSEAGLIPPAPKPETPKEYLERVTGRKY